MAVAAYAAVVSLMQVLDQIQQYPVGYLRLDRDRIETLHEKVSFLQDFLEVHSQRFYEDSKGLASQIAAVADEAEDIIDSHVVDQLHKGSADQTAMDLSIFCEDIDNLTEKIGLIKKELMMIKEGMAIQEQGPRVSVPDRSLAYPSSGSSTMIGFDEHLGQIFDKLTRDECDLQVLPIVGMGGIGKTTLARTAFDDQYMVQHFDKRIWVTISQDYSLKKILFSFLSDEERKIYEESDEAKLGERLYKTLYDRRYLVVIDDVWSTDVWNDLRPFFPDNSNGSRIMVTTRLSNVADSVRSSGSHLMDFLDEDKSWDLLCKKAFAKDGRCPPELEEVGKSITKSCRGLPLAIVVIGGLLSKSNMTREYWDFVAKNVNSFANSREDEYCLKILSLSYNHLPIHLKPCFLYMKEFPEDDEIEVLELIRLWVAQGFLKPIKDKTLEEVARECLEDLVGRSLILIRKWTGNGKMRECGIHDLLRDLCIKESHKEQFYCVPKAQRLKHYIRRQCFLCGSSGALKRIDLPRVVVSSQPTSLVSCSVCDNCRYMYPKLNRLRWVKVIKDEDVLHPTKVRYLSIYGKYFKSVDNSINLLWNLQTLIIYYRKIVLPSEIWELSQLRHIISRCTPIILPDPPLITQVDRQDSIIILKNLHTLSKIENFRWSEDAIERIPNLKILHIGYYGRNEEWSYYSLHNLGHLRKLDSLTVDAKALLTLKNITFPHSLKILSLQNCIIPWEEMSIIGRLPNLEDLQFFNAFVGPEWNPIEREFLRLKELVIVQSDLVRWVAEKSHFPILECLTLYWMKNLEEIPSGIGEIETLSSISIHGCSKSAVHSAKMILEEQHSFGNEDLQLHVDGKMVLPNSG